MRINVVHIAKLANLALTDGERVKFEKQLSSILGYVDKLKEVDTSKIEPTSQITGLENVTREDKTSSCFSQENALSNAKSKHNGFFKVKAILEE
ncbi:MAG: Asp-tRNA(Asn)/Glu-tRNA(Gln) amidotransferase subunit GatC [Candidatus Levybacteria bacterium]|nr:Asp-tRNA(Asn)/Glu-tRNA(Gln) amidotransferase subunit GatC [Candidatus Levybacteria bacterium]